MESLRVFEASARHCNFTRAANELGVTPTAVSLRVRDLEAELDRPLFVRHGPRIALTEAGAKLATRIEEILAIARGAVAECRASVPALRITANPSFAHWLASHLPKYDALASSTAIQLDVSPELRTLGRFDVAIRSGFGDWPQMRSVQLLPVLGTPMLSPALAAQYALRDPADLQALPLLPDAHWKSWFEQAGVADPKLKLTRTVMPTQDMASAAALNDTGAALLSPVLFSDLVAEGKLVRPFEQLFVAPEAYYVVWPKRDDRPAAQHFADWLCAEIASECRQLR